MLPSPNNLYPRQVALIVGDKHYLGKPCGICDSPVRRISNKACSHCEREKDRKRRAANRESERVRKRRARHADPERARAQRREWRRNMTPDQHRTKLETARQYRERDPLGTLALEREAAKAQSARRQEKRRRIAQLVKPLAEDIRRWHRRIANMTPEQREKARAESRASYERQRKNNMKRLKRSWQKHARIRRGRKRANGGDLTTDDLAMLDAMQGKQCAYCGATGDLHLDHAVPLSRGGRHTADNVQWLCAFHNRDKRTQTDDEYRRENDIPRITEWDGV